MRKGLPAFLLGMAVVLTMPYSASADLIFDADLGGVAGSGLGTVSTILTMPSPGSGSFESGSVSRSGGADVTSDTGVLLNGSTTDVGNVKTGASQTLTRTLGGNGITKASQIAIVFNADEALQTQLDAFSDPATAALRIGLSASASDATGGPETFNLATITAVPESGGTLLFTATALAGLSFVAWRRQNKLC